MEFRILGPLEVVDGERPIALRKGKECALLAYLLLHANEVVPSERLIDELWGEHPPPTAAKILQNAVSHLRKALGDGRLLTRGHGYELRAAPEELDLQQFQRLAEEGRTIGNAAKLRQALALWRGPALVDVRDETFAQRASLYLEEERLGVLEDRIAADLAEGRGAELVPELERLVRDHPLRERLHGQLMLALYRAGRQADALEAYQRARRTLMQELGLEPSPQLQKLERRVLNQDPELEAPPRPPRPLGPVSSPTRRRRLAALALGAVALVAAGVVGIVYALDHHGSGPLVAKPNSLAVVDPSRNRLVAVVPVGTIPRGVAVGSSVWVANSADGTVSRLDSRTAKVVQTVGIGAQATDIATGAGGVWVVTGIDNTLVQLDPRTGAVVGTLRLPKEKGDPVTSTPAVAVGEGAVWVASGLRLLKVDPATGTIVAGLRGLDCCHGLVDIAVGAGAVWIAGLNEVVVRISPRTAMPTSEPLRTVYPSTLAVGYGSVWVVGVADYIARRPAVVGFDPQTLRVTHTIRLGKSRHSEGTLGLAAGEGAIWVSDYDRGTLLRIDPETGTIVSIIGVGGHPSGVAVGAGRIWVSVD
jgi:DNA-binding SARP family transcriptional activator/DNA-binding beta-propeller fold protein YncE